MSRRNRWYGGCRVSMGRMRLECGHLSGVVIRHADEADQAFADEPVERLGCRGERRGRIRPVDLVDIHVVGAERREARFEVTTERGRAGVPDRQAVVVAEPALRGDDDRLAGRLDLGPERFTQEAFRGAEAVGMRRVEEGDPEVEGLAGCGDGRVTIDVAPVTAGRPVAECDPRDARAAVTESCVLHRWFLLKEWKVLPESMRAG